MTELMDEVLLAIRARRGREFTPGLIHADVLRERERMFRERHPRLPRWMMRLNVRLGAPTVSEVHTTIRILKLHHPHLRSLRRPIQRRAHLWLVSAA